MNAKNCAIPRNVLTDFCTSLGYDPREVITIHATSSTIDVQTMPAGVTGLEGVTTSHKIADEEA